MFSLSSLPSPSQWWKPFSYTVVDSRPEETTDHSPTRRPNVLQLLASRRVRVAAAALVSILVVAAILQSPSAPSPSPSPPPSMPPLDGGREVNLDDLILMNDHIDWTKYAYAQYVTNKLYLCNSVMMFESLHRLESKADRVMMYPAAFDPEKNPGSGEAKLLIKARDEYNVKLRPIQVQSRTSGDSTWSESYTKLLAFNQTDYVRVLGLDSDSTILRSMDELFLLPTAPMAMPRAYWIKPAEHRNHLSSQMILVEPSNLEFQRIEKAIEKAGKDEYDMEILNNLYGDSAMILPHRRYDLLTGEYRGKKHENYLGNELEIWDGQKILDEAKFLHFSDWPLPKPWLATAEEVDKAKPSCNDDKANRSAITDCVSQAIWVNFYTEFRRRRTEICGENSH